MQALKKFIGFALLCALFVGCSNNAEDIEPQNTETDSTQYKTLKWAVNLLSEDDKNCILNNAAAFNEVLHADGFKYNVEFVPVDFTWSADTFGKSYQNELIKAEKKNGPFDIIFVDGEWIEERGSTYDYLSAGYLAPLDLEALTFYDKIPDIFWQTQKVNDAIYTIPDLPTYTGLTFNFNTDYVSAEDIAKFDGKIGSLETILEKLPKEENLVPCYYAVNYLEFATSFSAISAKKDVVLRTDTKRAQSPYENELVLDFAKALNGFYNKGYLNESINFSAYEASENLDNKQKVAVYIANNNLELSDYDDEVYCGGKNWASHTLTYYAENNVITGVGISAKSEHKEAALELLNMLFTDGKYIDAFEISNDNKDRISFMTGLPTNPFPAEAIAASENAELSAFAGFELSSTVDDSYPELTALLVKSFDRLCKAENFAEELEVIKIELAAAGLDDYLAEINGIMEQKYAS